MSRSIVLNLLASALTILAAIALLGASAFVGDMQVPASSPSSSATITAVYAFYDAINEVLRTGDPTALQQAAPPDLLVHNLPPGIASDRSGLERYLLATRAVAPGMQLFVDALTVAGDEAIVHLTPQRPSAAHFLGVPLTSSPLFWGRFDAFRIENDRVVEGWTETARAPLLEELGRIQLETLHVPARAIRVERLSSPPGSDWILSVSFQSRVIYVFDGEVTLTVALDSFAPAVIGSRRGGRAVEREVLPGMSDSVTAGEAIRVTAPATVATLRPTAGQSAFGAYVVTFTQIQDTSPPPNLAHPRSASHPPFPSQLSREELVDEFALGSSSDKFLVSFGRITLPLDASLALAEADGALLLRVEQGSLHVDTLQCHMRSKEAISRTCEVASQRLGPGGASVVPTGASVTLQTVGDQLVTAIAVTVLPIDADSRIGN